MNKDKKNQIILAGSVIILIIGVIIAAVVFRVMESNKNIDLKVTFDQLYNSDYDLHYLDRGYFFGTYDNKLNVFIDGEGREILKTDTLIEYSDFYKMSNGSYLFYNNIDNKLSIYIFDGKEFKLYYSIDGVSYVKPIVNNDVIIGFTSFNDNKLFLYNLDNDGISVLNDMTLMADKFINNVYYSNSSNIVVENKDKLYGVVDIKGNTILDCKYKDVISLSNGNFIVKNDKDKYGIIDKDGKVLVSSKYDGIIPFDDSYIIVKGSKMALFNEKYKNVTGFKMNYNTLLEFNYRSDISVDLYNVGDNVIIINNKDEELYKRDYQYHNMYVIKDGKIVNTIKQVGFGYNKVLYTLDKDYNVSLYNDNMEVTKKFKLKNVNKVIDISYYGLDTLLIKYVNNKDNEVSEVFNYHGKVVKDEDKVLLSNSVYYVVSEDNKLIIKDYDDNELSEIVGNVVYVNDNYVIIDQILYRIVIE